MQLFAVTMDVRDMRRPADYLRQAYVRLLQEVGITPVLVPNRFSVHCRCCTGMPILTQGR